MFLGLAWYWWLLIAAAVVVSVPFKIKFMKWWTRRRQGKDRRGKWGEDE